MTHYYCTNSHNDKEMNLHAKPYLVASEWVLTSQNVNSSQCRWRKNGARIAVLTFAPWRSAAIIQFVRRSIAGNYLTLTVWRTCYSSDLRTLIASSRPREDEERKTLLKTPWKSSWIDNKLTFLNRCWWRFTFWHF